MQNFKRSKNEKEFRKIFPEPANVFREVPASERIQIPEPAERRTSTNLPCLVVFAIFVLLLIGMWLFIAGASRADLKGGKDRCGNVCGKKNEHAKKNCTPMDYSNRSVIAYKLVNGLYLPDSCTTEKDCREDSESFYLYGRCHIKKFGVLERVAYYCLFDTLAKMYPIMIIVSLFCIGACLLLLMVFRFYTRETLIVSFALGGLFMIFVLAGLGWFVYRMEPGKIRTYCGILYGILALMLALVYIWAMYKISKVFKLIVAIYQESTKAILFQPLLMVSPVLCICLIFAFFVVNYFSLGMAVCDTSKKGLGRAVKSIHYVMVMVMTIWVYHFVNGCNIMAVAGSISAYFFARNKEELKRPYQNSVWVMLRYHLGSIAAGSLIITILSIIRAIVRSMSRGDAPLVLRLLCCVFVCLLDLLEEFVEYLTKKAYIIIAMHAKGLYKSGQRAARLLWTFLLDFVLLDGFVYMGVNTLFVCIFLMAVFTSVGLVLAFKLNQYIYLILPIQIAFISVMMYFFCSVLNVATETVFFCFCEDRIMNDGSGGRPYAMPTELSDLLLGCAKDAQKKIDEKDEKHSDKN